MIQVMHEQQVIALHVLHAAAHAGKALAETEVIGRVGLGRFAHGPVPAAAVLQIDYIDGVIGDRGPAGLQPQIWPLADGPALAGKRRLIASG